MYKFTDDDKTNRDVEDARQRFRSLYERVCNAHAREPRVAVLAMLSVLIDGCQEPNTQFDAELAHNLCQITHAVADMIVAHHEPASSPANVAEKPAGLQRVIDVVQNAGLDGLEPDEAVKRLRALGITARVLSDDEVTELGLNTNTQHKHLH